MSSVAPEPAATPSSPVEGSKNASNPTPSNSTGKQGAAGGGGGGKSSSRGSGNKKNKGGGGCGNNSNDQETPEENNQLSPQGNSEQEASGSGGGGSGNSNSNKDTLLQSITAKQGALMQPTLTLTMYIPTASVGAVIGRRGQTIAGLQKLASQAATTKQPVRVSVIGKDSTDSFPYTYSELDFSEPNWTPGTVSTENCFLNNNLESNYRSDLMLAPLPPRVFLLVFQSS